MGSSLTAKSPTNPPLGVIPRCLLFAAFAIGTSLVVPVPTVSAAEVPAKSTNATRPKASPTSMTQRAADEREYERIKNSYPDTAEGHWRLAQWCGERGLTAQRQQHLQKVVELDPEHQAARRLLGYQKHNGQWVTQEELMTSRGYVRYKGRWRLPQEVNQLEQKRKQTNSENQWQGQLKKWRAMLDDDRAAEAIAKIREINDPYAIKALKKALEGESNQSVRLLYVDALARIGTPDAVTALVNASLYDDNEEVRLTAIDHLAEKKHPEVIAMYIQALRHKENAVVNRAAVGLAQMENPAAIPALIDALVTSHKFEVVQGSEGISATFGSVRGPGGTAPVSGLSTGQTRTIIEQRMANPGVRDALIKLTGTNYDFDLAAWKAWLASHKKDQSLDARRN
jgi:hypothetical protein